MRTNSFFVICSRATACFGLKNTVAVVTSLPFPDFKPLRKRFETASKLDFGQFSLLRSGHFAGISDTAENFARSRAARDLPKIPCNPIFWVIPHIRLFENWPKSS